MFLFSFDFWSFDGDWEFDLLKKSWGNILFDTFSLMDLDLSGDTIFCALLYINIIFVISRYLRLVDGGNYKMQFI